MTNEIAWGPWVLHDHKGIPSALKAGVIVELQIVHITGPIRVVAKWPGASEIARIAFSGGQLPAIGKVIRWRIQKPRSKALNDLIALAANPSSMQISGPVEPTRAPDGAKA
ncbi:hypothetical protein [Maritimibacter sp. DP1N21-5]|uniref:hypothetical protein n=1 Tax=Maritimibacter sp. DP1N21-5 TaxID=2836867 RepID=UPI001C4813D8|nr:hypothetical protein [Maritimibacter sp. DP1N21-5]MBV7408720.1 hypothetical protein [Maritimibacter sp. DP1N21-5]